MHIIFPCKTFQQKILNQEDFSEFVFLLVSSFDDVGVEVLGGERLDLVLDLGRRGLAHRLLLAQEDGGVTVDPVLQGLLAEVALVADRFEFAEIK